MWAGKEMYLDEEMEVVLTHVYPLGMGREHDTEHGLDCWCHPCVDEECPNVIVHNVMN